MFVLMLQFFNMITNFQEKEEQLKQLKIRLLLLLCTGKLVGRSERKTKSDEKLRNVERQRQKITALCHLFACEKFLHRKLHQRAQFMHFHS